MWTPNTQDTIKVNIASFGCAISIIRSGGITTIGIWSGGITTIGIRSGGITTIGIRSGGITTIGIRREMREHIRYNHHR